MDVERDLVRRAGAGQGRPAADLGVDRAMEMAAQDQLDLGVTRHDFGEGFAPQQADLVHVADAGDEGRMVHHHEGRHIRPLRQRAVEPVEPLAAELTAALPRDQRVEADKAQRIVVDRELEELPLGRQVATVAEGVAHRLALVVIAGDGDDTLLDRCQDRLQVRVFLRSPEIDQVTGQQDDVGLRAQRQQLLHAALQHGSRVDLAIGELARQLDMGVGDLGDQHGSLLTTPIGHGGRWRARRRRRG